MVLLKKMFNISKTKYVRYLNLVVWGGAALPANKNRALLDEWNVPPTSGTGWDPSGRKEENERGQTGNGWDRRGPNWYDWARSHCWNETGSHWWDKARIELSKYSLWHKNKNICIEIGSCFESRSIK